MEINCPNPRCARRLNAPPRHAGRILKCPSCGERFSWEPIPTNSKSFVIYDLETTGLRPQSDEFIQIAAMRFCSGCLNSQDTYFSFARPRIPIPPFIESYTGIGNHHVRNAPRPGEVLTEFARWAGDAILIAHNGKRFDSKFLEATCRRENLPSRTVRCIDSIRLSKMVFGSKRGTLHNLDIMLSRLGISASGVQRHDARGDVELLGKAIETMWHRLGLDDQCKGVEQHETLLPRV